MQNASPILGALAALSLLLSGAAHAAHVDKTASVSSKGAAGQVVEDEASLPAPSAAALMAPAGDPGFLAVAFSRIETEELGLSGFAMIPSRGPEAPDVDDIFEDEEEAGWSFFAGANVVSDYRYRGISLSAREPAMQVEASAAAPNGVYVYGWASQVADNGGEDVELMGAIGWSGALFSDDLSLDLYTGYYAYPGVEDSALFELSAQFTRMYGDVSLTSGVSYYPEQANLGDLDDTYLSLALGAPLGFAGASGSIGMGWEQGAFGDGKIDWLAAVEAPISAFTVRVGYAGAARHFYGRDGADSLFAEIRVALVE